MRQKVKLPLVVRTKHKQEEQVDDLLLPIQHQVNGANRMEQNMRGNEEILLCGCGETARKSA
jgi:hypothetical protein